MTSEDARDLEDRLIREFKPKHNERKCIRALCNKTRSRSVVGKIIAQHDP